jgi:hypothetical protein
MTIQIKARIIDCDDDTAIVVECRSQIELRTKWTIRIKLQSSAPAT